MPRKLKDPIVAVMQYFETASIEAARQALVVVGEIVQRRSTTKIRTVHVAKEPVIALPVTQVMEEPVQAPKPRRRKIPTEQVAHSTPNDTMARVPAEHLPGLQSLVGE